MRIQMGAVQLIAGDVNRDGCVTQADVALVQAAQGSMSGYALFDADLDASPNGYIGLDDLAVVNANLGRCR